MIGRLIGHRESPKVQHNCHDSGCRVEKTKIRLIERVVAKSDAFEVDHTDANSYILNSGVLYLAKTHRHWVDIQMNETSPQDWISEIKVGLSNWKASLNDKSKKQAKRVEKLVQRSTVSSSVHWIFYLFDSQLSYIHINRHLSLFRDIFCWWWVKPPYLPPWWFFFDLFWFCQIKKATIVYQIIWMHEGVRYLVWEDQDWWI